MNDSTRQKVEAALNDLIERRRMIFWYDEGGQMQEFAASLSLPGIESVVVDGNPFSVKHHILTSPQPERGWLIYSPHACPPDEDNWLLDLQVQSLPFAANMRTLYAVECNIPVELKDRIIAGHKDFFSQKENRDRLVMRNCQTMDADSIELQMLAITCKTDPHFDQLIYALASEAIEDKTEIQEKLEKYNLAEAYWVLIEKSIGYKGIRAIKDLLIALFMHDLDPHGNQSRLSAEASIFMRDWRDSNRYVELYKQWATKLQTELSIANLVQNYPLEKLARIETFPLIDVFIAQHLQREVLNSTMTVEKMEDIVEQRENKIFFEKAAHTIKALLEVRRMVEDIDRKMPGLIINSASDGFRLYTQELYKIDMHYRHYFREAGQAEGPDLLAPVTEMVQRVYTNGYLLQLANKWQPMVDSMEKWGIEGFTAQRFFFTQYAKPILEKSKLFVIICDALRYETMVEVEQRVAGISRMAPTMKPAMYSTLPSYTQLGMAALLPNNVLSYEKMSDEVFADGISTKGTESRKKVLANRLAKSIAMTAEDFLNTPQPKTFFKDYDLIYIYSNIIDKTGDDKVSEGKVFKATDEEIEHIVQMIEKVRNANGYHVLVTSDHGYIYQNEQLDESDFTDFRVMGETLADSRRFVIGKGLQPGNAVNTWESDKVGLKAGMMIQTAKGLNRIRKQGSGSRFVHGGSMLQEVVVPVLHINIKKSRDISEVDVEVLNRNSRITTNNQVIGFYQTEPVSEKVKGITIKAGFYDEEGNLLSDSVTLTFDSQSNESTQREQKHGFIFRSQLFSLNGQTVALRLEKKVPNSDHFSLYKEIPYKVSVMFQAEF